MNRWLIINDLLDDLLNHLEYGSTYSDSYKLIYSTIESIVYYCYEPLSKIPMTDNPDFDKSFIQWNTFLSCFMEKCYDLGEYTFALRILKRLYRGERKNGTSLHKEEPIHKLYINIWECLLEHRRGASIIDTINKIQLYLKKANTNSAIAPHYLSEVNSLCQRIQRYLLDIYISGINDSIVDLFIGVQNSTFMYKSGAITNLFDNDLAIEWHLYYIMCDAYLDAIYNQNYSSYQTAESLFFSFMN